MTPFTYVDSIFDKKTHHTDLSAYSPFIINKTLSLHIDTILYANEMNMYAGLPLRMQYDYLFYSVRGQKRRTKWLSKAKKSENLEAIKEYFQLSDEKAKSALAVLSPQQIAIIKEKIEKGE